MVLLKHHFISDNIDTLVCSPGGVATTSFMEFIRQYRTINDPWDRDGLKHIDRPPLTRNSNLKAIYIYGDPLNLIISLFRRNYQEVHSRKLLANYPTIAPILETEGIDDYLDKSVDRLKLENHFKNWKRGSENYPIMMIKYEDMWNNLPEVFNYLEIPASEISNFPEHKKRSADWRKASIKNQKKLHYIYGELFREIQKFDNISINQKNKKLEVTSGFSKELAIVLIRIKKRQSLAMQSLSRYLKENHSENHRLIKRMVRLIQH